MCHGLSCGMRVVEHKRCGIQTIGVGKGFCVGSHGDVRPACQLCIGDPWMMLAGNSALGESVAVGVEVVTQALNEAVSLRRLHTVNEACQAGDALLEASFVDWIRRHLCLGIDGLGD